MAAPDALIVEVEFTAGVWTDVSAYVDWSAGLSTKFGRSSVYSTPQPATLTLTLDNTDGRFSPLRSVLADGVTAHPYWPNVVPRKRIRYSYTVGATTYRRFVGEVRGWPVTAKDAWKPRVTIEATDITERLSRVKLGQALSNEILEDAPAFYWPLGEPSGAAAASEVITGKTRNALTVGYPASDGALAFGSGGPGADNGSSVDFNPTAGGTASIGQLLVAYPQRAPDPTTPFTLEVWFNAGTAAPSWGTAMILGFYPADATVVGYLGIDAATGHLAYNISGEGAAGTTNVYDGGWHHVVVRRTASVIEMYVDGALQSSSTTLSSVDVGRINSFVVGDYSYLYGASRYTGRVAHVAMYASALSTARIAAHYSGGRSWVGETVDARIARFLGDAGLTSSDWNLDASEVAVYSYAQNGTDVITAVQDMVASEGGGAAFYIAPDGAARFLNRYTAASAATPDVVLDAAGDLDGNNFTAAYDIDQILTQVIGERYTASGTQATFIVDSGDPNVISDSTKSNAVSDEDARALAELKLARQRTAAYRVSQLTVDLWTATTAGLYAALGSVKIGSILEVRNLHATLAPSAYIDLTVQGWTETVSDVSYTVTFDTDAADNPAPLVWGGTGTDSRWQADGQSLNAAISSSATTIVIKTTAGKPTFTISAGAYPLDIEIDGEIITLNNPPTGSFPDASPQTFNGVTRGVTKRGGGGPAAAHAVNAVVQLFPTSAWTI